VQKWTGRDIQADEVVQDVSLGWDAKRDRWNGYDPKEYKAVIDEYTELEELKKKASDTKEDEEDEGEDGAKYAEESDMGRQQMYGYEQLRIREDTAKYLLNLDLDLCKIRSKDKSMVDSEQPRIQLRFSCGRRVNEGLRNSAEFRKKLKVAWESQRRGKHQTTSSAKSYVRRSIIERRKKEEAGQRDSPQKDVARKVWW